MRKRERENVVIYFNLLNGLQLEFSKKYYDHKQIDKKVDNNELRVTGNLRLHLSLLR